MKMGLILTLAAAVCLTGASCKSENQKQIMDRINELGGIFSEMVENEETFGAQWKNIPLGKKAFVLMKDEIPLRVEGELTPYTRIVLLNKMISCMPERDCARFFLEVKKYQESLFRLIRDEDDAREDMDIDGYEGSPEEYVREYTLGQHEESLLRTQEYLDASVTMEAWCRKYNILLKFDPIERSQQWEDCIYEVEKVCAEKLAGEPKGMGFCYLYWSTKKAVLAKFGIEWNSPAVMNPRVMFD